MRVCYLGQGRIDGRGGISYFRGHKEYLRLEISDCRLKKSTIYKINLNSHLSVFQPTLRIPLCLPYEKRGVQYDLAPTGFEGLPELGKGIC